MLNDDIANGTSWIADRGRRLIGGAVKGAILVGALAIAAGAVYFAWPFITAAGVFTGGVGGAGLTFGNFFAGLGTTITALTAGALFTAQNYGLAAAAAGATVLGVSSVLPSARGMMRSSSPDPRLGSSSMDSNEIALNQAISQNPNRAQQYQFDNPYAQPDLGAKLVARGNQASQTLDGIPTRT